MDRKTKNRQYEEFEPSTKWVQKPEYDTLAVQLPGFKKEQLQVQVTTLNNLRIRGERPLDNNKWSHFRMEFPISSNYNTNEISAKFEGGSLYIKLPKLITTEDQKPQKDKQPKEEATIQNAPSEPKTPEEDRMQKVASKQKSLEEMASAQQVPPKTDIEKQQMEKANEVTDSADDLSRKEAKTKSSEKKSEDLTGEDDKISKGTMEMDENRGQTGLVSGRDEPRVNGLNQVVSRLVTDIKQPRNFLINLVVTSLLVLVLAIYARNAIRSIGKSNN